MGLGLRVLGGLELIVFGIIFVEKVFAFLAGPTLRKTAL